MELTHFFFAYIYIYIYIYMNLAGDYIGVNFYIFKIKITIKNVFRDNIYYLLSLKYHCKKLLVSNSYN